MKAGQLWGRAVMKGLVKSGVREDRLDEELYVGELAQLDDEQWEKVVMEFLRR